MKEALDLASKSGIHRLITALEERGFIRRLPNRARALEVLRLPDSIAPGLNTQKKFAPSVIEGSWAKRLRHRHAPPPWLPMTTRLELCPYRSWGELLRVYRFQQSRIRHTPSAFRPK